MSWAALTLADLKTRFSDSEYDAVSAAALGAQDADEMAESVIADVVQLVRGKVAACAANVLSAVVTQIPAELRDAALAIARGRVLTRLPGMGALLDEVRREEIRSAERLLDAVAACKFSIEQPDAATSQAMTSPKIGIITEPTRTMTRTTMGRLL